LRIGRINYEYTNFIVKIDISSWKLLEPFGAKVGVTVSQSNFTLPSGVPIGTREAR
jgi:hypothetical protein